MATKPPVIHGGRHVYEPDDDDGVSPDVVQRFKDRFAKAHTGDVSRFTTEALNWFRVQVSKNFNPKASQILTNNPAYVRRTGANTETMIGKLYLFQYEAEEAGDEETGLYDRYPMVFIFNATKTAAGNTVLWGLNMHYLSPRERMLLYQELLNLKTNKRWSKNVRMKLSWNLIKGVAKSRLYSRAVHAYRLDRVQSRLVEIPAYDWNIAVFLRLEKFIQPKSHIEATKSQMRRRIIKRATTHKKNTSSS